MPKTVLITGCSEGSLGSALALAFDARGAKVIATARSESKLAHLKSHGNITIMLLDVCDKSSVQSCVSSIPQLNILVNNAGGLYAMPLSDANLYESKRLFDLNVWAQLAVTISSVTNVPWNGIYNASKAALAMLTDTMRLELEPFGVKVIELKTGAVKSAFYQNQIFGSEITLPAESPYRKAASIIERSMTGKTVQPEAMKMNVWAKQVVEAILKTDPEPRIWKGTNAFAVWFARRFMPIDFLDGNMRKMGGLGEVKKALASGRRE